MPGIVPVRKGAGQLRHRVALQEGIAITDAIGGRTQSWSTYGHDQVAMEPVPLVVSDTQASVIYTVTLRYRSDLDEKQKAGTQQRVVGGGRTLKVLAVVDPEQRHRDLILQCAVVTT